MGCSSVARMLALGHEVLDLILTLKTKSSKSRCAASYNPPWRLMQENLSMNSLLYIARSYLNKYVNKLNYKDEQNRFSAPAYQGKVRVWGPDL